MKKQPAYTEEFRKEAVRLSAQPGRSVGSVAKELGVSATSLVGWRRKYLRGTAAEEAPPETDPVRELNRLKREVQQLRMEREILKKATAFFAKENT
jgi:transposase